MFICKLFNLLTEANKSYDLKGRSLTDFQTGCKNIIGIIIDEYSMIKSVDINHVSNRLKQGFISSKGKMLDILWSYY